MKSLCKWPDSSAASCSNPENSVSNRCGAVRIANGAQVVPTCSAWPTRDASVHPNAGLAGDALRFETNRAPLKNFLTKQIHLRRNLTRVQHVFLGQSFDFGHSAQNGVEGAIRSGL